MLKRLGLRSKILMAIIPVVLTIIVVSGFWNYRTSSKIIMDQQVKDVEIVLQQADTALTHWIDSCEREVLALGENQAIRDAFEEDTLDMLENRLKRAEAKQPFFESLWLADPDGLVLVDSAGGRLVEQGRDLAPEFHHDMASSSGGGAHLSGVLKSPLSSRPVFLLTTPIKSNGRVIGIFGGTVKVDDFWSTYLGKLRFGEKGYAYLNDRSGTMISHPNRDYIFKIKFTEQDFGRKIMSLKNGHLFYEWEGDTKIAFFKTNEKSGWISVLAPLPEEFLAPVQKIKYQTLLVGGISILLVFVATWFLVGWIIETLKGVSQSLKAVSLGDLSRRMAVERSDEIGDLVRHMDVMIDSLDDKVALAGKIAAGDISSDVSPASPQDKLGLALRNMVGNLNDLITQIRSAAGMMATGSDQISVSSQSLSQGATEQASALEETTASISEMTSQTRLHAETTDQAVVLAEEVRQQAEDGLTRMNQMVSAISEMSQCGRRISGIIKVIEDIAFQTNLLALNAAVEAARAGRHGQGFAVVAQEVRNLAGRSAKAAGQTHQLIAETIQKMETGDETVQATADVLTEIVEGIGKVSAMVEDIAVANRGQAVKIAEMNVGLSQIEQVTQNNSANAEQTASAAEELASQAEHLNRLVARFKVKRNGSKTIDNVAADITFLAHDRNQGWPEQEPEYGHVHLSNPLIPYSRGRSNGRGGSGENDTGRPFFENVNLTNE